MLTHYAQDSATPDWLRMCRRDCDPAVAELRRYVRDEFDPDREESMRRADRLWREAVRRIRAARGM
jgi:hypothetical protein